MLIELHLLQNFAPSNLNRDDTNNPKDCWFGGHRRARISSQCIKRATRLHPVFEKYTQIPPAERTRYMAPDIARLLMKKGKPEEEAKAAAIGFTDALLGGMDKNKPERSKVLFYISHQEMEEITSLIEQNWDGLKSKEFAGKDYEPMVKEFTKKFSDQTSAPDVAMFGRMLAKDPDLNLDAACQVAHAISTHRVNMEFDFFTAVDDLNQVDSGAGMMGMTGFNSACFYRYAVIDFDQLVTNLGGDNALAKKTVEGFLRASIAAVPSGKQNSFAAQNPPEFLMAVVREDGLGWSLANAFEKPVQPKGDQGLMEVSVQVLDEYWNKLSGFYGNGVKPVVGTIGLTNQLQTLNDFVKEDINAWVDAVIQTLPKE